MRVVLCGVRGSTPSPGASFVRYGGQTSCVAVSHDGEVPRLLLDGGTGLRFASSLMDGRPFVGTVLLGHLHWDHTHGLPFFPAGVRSDSEVTVLFPDQGEGCSAEEVLDRAFSPPHFPVRLRELAGSWRCAMLADGEHRIEGFAVTALDIPHPGGRTFGFRVTDGHATVAFLSDHGPLALGPGPEGLGEYHETAVALAAGADLLIHDAQHTAAELPDRAYLGHSAAEYAIGLGRVAGVKRVLLYHHDPLRTDDQLDSLAASMSVTVGAESMTFDLPEPE